MTSPNQASLSFARKLEKAKTFLQIFAKCEDQENSIPKIAGKAKIEGDKLPKVTNSLVESLNKRDSPAIDRITTRVKVSVASRASASLPGQYKDAMNLSFGEVKGVKTVVISKVSKEGRRGSVEDSLKREKNSLKKDCKDPIYRPIA